MWNRSHLIGSVRCRPPNGITTVSFHGPEPPIVGPRRCLISVGLRRDSRKFRVGILHVFCMNQVPMPAYRDDGRLSIHQPGVPSSLALCVISSGGDHMSEHIRRRRTPATCTDHHIADPGKHRPSPISGTIGKLVSSLSSLRVPKT